MNLLAAPSEQLVRAHLAHHMQLRDRLAAEIPDLDDETLADTVEGLSNLDQLLIAVVRSALEDEMYIDALADRIRIMRHRFERLQHRANKKRELTRRAMQDGEIPKLTAADFTALLKNAAPILEIISASGVPAQFWKPQEPKLDRLGLIAALKNGFRTDAAKLSDPALQLSVRTK